jgi:antitoxin (DNA-binding transcriptional repressor) of toxin-antitoxin stability system
MRDPNPRYKARAGAILRRIKAGEAIEITERGKPVAHIGPIQSSVVETWIARNSITPAVNLTYVDTSDIPKLFIAEAETCALKKYLGSNLITSGISRLEVQRVIDRNPELSLKPTTKVLDNFQFIEPDQTILAINALTPGPGVDGIIPAGNWSLEWVGNP